VLFHSQPPEGQETRQSRAFQQTVEELRLRDPGLRIHSEPWAGDDPTDHVQLFDFLREKLPAIRRKFADRELILHVSPGTPSMQTVLVLMGETGFIDPPFVLVKSYRKEERNGRPAVVPVQLGIDSYYKAYRAARPSEVSSEDASVVWDPARFKSSRMREIFDEARRFAQLNVPVLLLGERGTGKTTLAGWLNERFVLIDQYSGSKVFISGSPTPESDHRRPFRMHGKGYAIDVQKTPEDKLLLTRLVEARRGASAEERRPIVPVQGNVRFCDSTIAGAFRGAARSQLDQLVEQAGSYLNVWREYNKLERDSVFRRARTLGWLSYSEAKRQADGRWRFRIQDSKQLDTALNLLRGAEDVELEAASQPPRELQDSSDSSSSGLATEGGATRSPRAFVGSFVGGDSGRYLDVLPTGDLDDREPPIPGVLFMSMSGDRRRLERRERAQASIALAECPMPQLGLLLEGSAVPERRRKTETALSAVVREVFGGDPTPRQIEAIRVALNTPDIALIQGPPGTGKTKTIAALQARLAELGEDGDLAGQTLLTSYQHDAVENAAAIRRLLPIPWWRNSPPTHHGSRCLVRTS